jgi:photosystem II stability/assembly factor-like uncharacterized protein
LGVNPSDGALFIATHSGLFRAPPGASEPARVDDQFQDTMGFSVIGPDSFLGSGHPAPGEGGPPNLGLIESTDAGRSWRSVSLAGEADFHVLRFSQGRVYGYNGLTGKLMVSGDRGESWSERTPPPGVIDLAIDPRDSSRIVAATEQGLAMSEDEGETWQPLAEAIGLLAWPETNRLYLIDAGGRVARSTKPGDEWTVVGRIGGQPVALIATGADRLYAGLPDGTVKQSLDGGASWHVRASL